MISKSQKQEQKQIKRLRDILFPKNKAPNKTTQTDSNSNEFFEGETKRQVLQPTRQANVSNSAALNNKKSRQKFTKINDASLLHEIKKPMFSKDQSKEIENEKHKNVINDKQPKIKKEICKLRQQITTMLEKWNDVDQKDVDEAESSENQKNLPDRLQQYKITKEQQEQMANQHYLKSINQISKNLEKYNAYMFGIKQATQELLEIVPVNKEDILVKHQPVRSYKLFYLASLLTNYFAAQIQTIRVKRLQYALRRIWDASQINAQIDSKEQQKRLLNKGNFLFLRKNLLDKAFNKWRINSSLLKFKESLIQGNDPSCYQISNFSCIENNKLSQRNQNTHEDSFHKKLKISEFLLKNILHKQRIVQYLQNYLLDSLKATQAQMDLKTSKENCLLKQQVQIVLFDQQNNELFSFVNYNSSLQNTETNIVESRVANVLESVTDYGRQTLRSSTNEGKRQNYRKYCFGLKNSLTRMCIDSQKTIRIPEMKRNEVYCLEVDGSINQQVWIRTSKTNRQMSSDSNKINLKRTLFSQEVFYEQKSLAEQLSYLYDSPNVRTSAIFYPIVHQGSMIGLIRQYVYHSKSITLPNFEIPYENLQLATQSLFETFEMSYSFERLRRENSVIDRKYAIKVLKMIGKIQEELKIVKMDQNQNQPSIVEKMMTLFSTEMNSLFVQKIKENQDKSMISTDQCWNMLAFRVNRQSNNNLLRKESSKIYFYTEQMPKQNFMKVYESKINNLASIQSFLQEFHQQSRNKDTNLQVIKDFSSDRKHLVEQKLTLKKSEQCFVLIKAQRFSQSEQLYFVFILNGDDSSPLIQKSLKDRASQVHQKNEFLPPLQLVLDISNKFTQLLEKGLLEYRCNQQTLKINSQISQRNKRAEFENKMRQFYLESVKNFIHMQQKQRLNTSSDVRKTSNQKNRNDIGMKDSYIFQLNNFIEGCTNSLVRQLKNLQLQSDWRLQQKSELCKVEYLVEISLPQKKISSNNEGQISQQVPGEIQKSYILISIVMTGILQTQVKLQNLSGGKGFLSSLIQVNVLSEWEYSKIPQDLIPIQTQIHYNNNDFSTHLPDHSVQGKICLQIPKFIFKNISFSQTQNTQTPIIEQKLRQSSTGIILKQEIQNLLRPLIQNYISVTQNLLSEYLHSSMDRNDDQQENKNSTAIDQIKGQNPMDKIKALEPWIKNRIFEVFELDQAQSQQINGNLKINQANSTINEEIKQNKARIQATQTMEVSKQALLYILSQETNFKAGNIQLQINEKEMQKFFEQIRRIKDIQVFKSFFQPQCQFHQFISSQFLSVHQSVLGSTSFDSQISQTNKLSFNDSLIVNVIGRSKVFREYCQKLTINKVLKDTQVKQNPSTSAQTLMDLIHSSYFTLSVPQLTSQSQLNILIIKIKNSALFSKQMMSSRQIFVKNNFETKLLSLKKSFESTVKTAIQEYFKLFNYQRNILKLNTIISGISLLTQTKILNQQQNSYSTDKQTNENEDEKQDTSQCPRTKKGFITRKIGQAWIKILSFSQNQTFKAKKLLSISKIVQKSKTKNILNHLSKWRKTTKEISHQQILSIIKTKIVENLREQRQKITFLIDKVGQICVYDKILSKSFTKIFSYSKYNRLSDFKNYRQKQLGTALEKLNKTFDRSNLIQMKRFFSFAYDILCLKRKEQFRREKMVNMFVIEMENTSFFKRKIKSHVKSAFNLIKLTYLKKNKQNPTQSLSNNENTISLDQKITKTSSISSIKAILYKQFSQYDIWVKLNKKYDEYITLSISNHEFRAEKNLTMRNLSFDDQPSSASFRLNNNLQAARQRNQKFSKEQLFAFYPEEVFATLETSQTIFICRNVSSPSQILNEISYSSEVSNVSSTISMSFKQKEKLHSLAKCLAQFFSNHKLQLSIKLSYLDSIYETLKRKRFSLAFTRWKKFHQNQLLIATYQLADNVYQLNIEMQNCKERVKTQQKEINDNKNQYNRLLKKESQQKSKVQKYSLNIQVLNKLLEDYHKIQKKQDDVLRSATKSSRKSAKIYQGPIVDILSLDEEEKNVIVLSLTRWRQINANQKLKELRTNNLSKQIKILQSCVKRNSNLITRKLLLDCFQQVLSYSIYVKQEIEQQQQRERQRQLQQQRLEKLRLEREKQMKQQAQREKKMKQQAQREKEQRQRLQREKSAIKRIEREKIQKQRLQMQKMQQLFISAKSKSREQKNHTSKNQTLMTQIPTLNDKSMCTLQETTNQNTKIQLSRNIDDSSDYRYEVTYENFTEQDSSLYKTANQSLADQLQESFTELNRRLVTFQKNNTSPSSDSCEFLTEAYFNSYDVSEVQRVNTSKENVASVLDNCRAPNNTVDVSNQGSKMSEEEKIRFQLEKMKMKKPHFNKENLTVTQEEYQKLNGGNAYKLGGKTLRFLKRMGKLQSTDREEK